MASPSTSVPGLAAGRGPKLSWRSNSASVESVKTKAAAEIRASTTESPSTRRTSARSIARGGRNETAPRPTNPAPIVRPAGLPVHLPLARVLLEHDCLVADRLHVLGQERDLPAASRRVDHEMGHGEPRGPPAQRSDDLQALLDRGAEMLRPRYLVAHIDVVRPHPRSEQFLHQ